MNQVEDDYAILQAYIQLVENEIEEVISGRLPCQTSLRPETQTSLRPETQTSLRPETQTSLRPETQTSLRPETQTSFNKINDEQIPVFPQENIEKARKERGTKPPRGFVKESRAGTKKAESFERRKAAMCFGKGNRETLLQESSAAKLRGVRTEGVAPTAFDKVRSLSDDDWSISALEDLCVVEDTEDEDFLLESILDKERKPEFSVLTNVTSVDYATLGSTRMNEHPMDLQELLLFDRNRLLLGRSENMGKSDGVTNDSKIVRYPALRNVVSSHHCKHPRHHHKHHHHRHHRYTDPGVCPPLQPDHQPLRRHSSQPCHHLHHHHRQSLDCSVKGSLDEHRQKESAEMLMKINEDVKRVTRSLSSERPCYKNSSQFEPASTMTLRPSDLPLLLTDIGSECFVTQNSLAVREDDISASDKSGTDSELRNLFDPPKGRFTFAGRGKLSRKSYPTDGDLIISPPPGFDSPVSDEMWIKIRLITRSHDDLEYKGDQIVWPVDRGEGIANSAVQYYAVPLELESNPESRCYIAQTTDDLHLHFNSPNLEKNDLAYNSPTKDTQKDDLPFNSPLKNMPRNDLPYNFLIQDKHKNDLPYNSPINNEQKNHLPHNSPIKKGLRNENVGDHSSQKTDFKEGMMEYSCSSQDESLDLSTLSESSSSERSGDVDCSSTEGYYTLGHDAGLKKPEHSVTLLTSNGDFRPLIISVNETDIRNTTNILPLTTVDSSTSRINVQNQQLPFQTAQAATENIKENYKIVKRQSSPSFSVVLNVPQTGEEQATPRAEVTNLTIDPNLPVLLNLEEDNNNNNTSSNIFSMCLASNCKHLKSNKSQKVSDSFYQPRLKIQNIECLDEVSNTHLAYESNKCTPRPDGSNIEPNYILHLPVGNEANSVSRLPRNNSCSTGSLVKEPIFTETSCTNTSIPEVEASCRKDSKCELDLGRILNSVEATGKNLMKKSSLKDTAVQTSLVLEGSLIDCPVNVPSQDMVVREVTEGGAPTENAKRWTDSTSENSRNRSVMAETRGETSEKQRKFMKVNGDETDVGEKVTVTIVNGNDKEVLQNTNSEVLRPSKVSFLRSKSIHGNTGDGHDSRSTQSLRPDGPDLCGSLRELSHLNIDVSQRLVDGEQRFVVANGSPELQVMVNALTPVLSRRNRIRNARRLQQVTPKEEMLSIITTSARGNDLSSNVTADSSLEISSQIEFRKPTSSQTVFHSSEDHLGNDNLPEHVWFKSADKSCGTNENVDVINVKENVSTYQNGLKEMKPVSGKRIKIAEFTVANSGTDSAAQQMNKTDRPGSHTGTGRQHDLAVESNDLSEELEESRKSLFLSPKLAHTWHGASAGSAHRPAPRMGVSRMLGDGVKFICDRDRKIRPVVLMPSLLTSSPEYPQNSYTMPVISRTLLDALHKRYCAHQYSSHYQTLQPFSLLKLDSTISSRNHFVTALLVEPRLARDHEVQAAPPSPEVMTRLRMLINVNESETDKDGGQSLRQQNDQEQRPRHLRLPQISGEWPFQQCTTTCYHSQPQTLKPSQSEEHHDVWPTPNSSPNLSDVSTFVSTSVCIFVFMSVVDRIFWPMFVFMSVMGRMRKQPYHVCIISCPV